ncbi:MAG TPA: DUF5606 domain-containing protein [Bacteroidia bacterium]|nr:DUF5606 domain-containing protein [Bacteroidia bacterium]
MKLSEIIAVSGMAGLYKTIAQAKGSVIVESLDDKKRMPVYASQRVHTLEAISVFCTDKDIPLAEVFTKIAEKEKKGPALDHKSSETDMLKYFGEVLPDFDKERVHTSDIRKMLMWYNILQKNNMLDFEEETPVAEGEEGKADLPVSENAPVKKAAPKHQQKQAAPKPQKAAGGMKQTVRKTGVA